LIAPPGTVDVTFAVFMIEMSAFGVEVGVVVATTIPVNLLRTSNWRDIRPVTRSMSPSAFVLRAPSLLGSLSNNWPLYGKKLAVEVAVIVS
jgi:hypothetical protein